MNCIETKECEVQGLTTSVAYTAKEVKKLIASKKAAKAYEKGKIKPLKDSIDQAFIGGSRDYDIVIENVRSIYLSGDNLGATKLLKKKHFERYMEKYEDEHLINPSYDWEPPKLSDEITFGSFAIPKVYRIGWYDSQAETSVVSFDLPQQFIYSGNMDRLINLSRWSGYSKDRPYKCEELNFIRQVNSYWNRNMSEREILEYIFDLFPYAVRFGNENWIQSVIDCNRGTQKLWGLKTNPYSIRGSEHIMLSSKCIPFEIEGKLYTIDLNRYMEILELYRTREYYDIGGCDDNRLFILHLIYSEELDKTDQEIKDFLLSDDSPTKVGLGEIEEIVSQVPRNNIGFTDEELYYYYASESQRLELRKILPLSEKEFEKIRFMSEYNYRELFLGMMEIDINRSETIENWKNTKEHEDSVLNKLSDRYGIRVSTKLEEYSMETGELDLPEGGLDFFFEDEEIYPDLETIAPERIDRSETVFEVDFATWNTFGADPLDPVHRVWDPGGESRLQDPGREKPSRKLQ